MVIAIWLVDVKITKKKLFLILFDNDDINDIYNIY